LKPEQWLRRLNQWVDDHRDTNRKLIQWVEKLEKHGKDWGHPQLMLEYVLLRARFREYEEQQEALLPLKLDLLIHSEVWIQQDDTGHLAPALKGLERIVDQYDVILRLERKLLLQQEDALSELW